MQIEQHTVVGIAYKLSISDAENPQPIHIETIEQAQPMVFLFGQSGLPPHFERCIEGLTLGSSFEFTLTKDDAYGDFLEANMIDLNKEMFIDSETKTFDTNNIQMGNILNLVDEEGIHHRGQVVDITDTTVKMDFNHPLSGRDLHFAGSVVSLRKATQEEINHNHVHGEGGHQH